jgi:hypothetical protein
LVIATITTAHAANKLPPRETVEKIVHSGIAYLGAIQVSGKDGVYIDGEWKAQVYSGLAPVILGIGSLDSPDEEPSAFTTASIANQLAVIYQEFPQYSEIPALVAKAVPSFERYREGAMYNFYPPRMWRGVRVHQTATMTLAPIWKGFTNIPEDADTSSVSYAARHYHALFQGKKFQMPRAALKSFSSYRDLNRAPHYYNERYRLVNTGAFMTWQMDENDPAMPRFYFAEPEEGKRIPFNDNDVDCIVNLNVLRMLALTENSDIKGRDQACGLLAYQIQSKQYPSCGIYYPNTFNFAYSAALADKAGEKCLRPYSDEMMEYVLKTQSKDGGWYNVDNDPLLNDRLNSTSFAVYSLTHFGDKDDPRVRKAVAKGLNFILAHMKTSRSGYSYWAGEVFFTATALARTQVNWKSNAYTTSLALVALAYGERFLRAEQAH